jgi:hypothetical protein
LFEGENIDSLAIDLEYDLILEDSNVEISRREEAFFVQEELSLQDIHNHYPRKTYDQIETQMKQEYESSFVSFSQGKTGQQSKFGSKLPSLHHPNSLLNTETMIENILANPRGLKRLKISKQDSGDPTEVKLENCEKMQFHL